ncbi:RHS repeat-associated core domain-containing protein [Labedaea rhizosphaerae]|uniref:RHS repeat-associated protein n=1 Tax=Labedaea rhizosphaerae TaxID=598644 RepID=A0A4R6RXQ5_LABRH|nr:RHS repeat-associated core domain-containing protein [Labedaea rhizosphaerae]TDP91869.1 RHS repeat-associated protein [Labedaea rhizosphaerae]
MSVRSRFGRFTRLCAAVSALVLLVSTQDALATPPEKQGLGWSLPALQKERSVAVHNVPTRPLPADKAAEAAKRPRVQPHWPAATDAEVALATGAQAKGAGVQSAAPNTPIRVGYAKAATATATMAPAKVALHVTDQSASTKLGLSGVVFSVRDTPGAAAHAPVRVSVDYGSFADAYGGGWADRLRLVRLPACALTTPQKPSCRTQTVLPAPDNNRGAHTVSAELTMSTSDNYVLAATAGTSGSAGDLTAQPLSPAGSWSAGGSSGDFNYSYPFSTVPSVDGTTLSVGLSYSSGMVDGRTSATNNQASIVGDGWDLSTGGYLERHYKSCAEDLGGNNGQTKTGDQCWGVDNATLVLGGRSTELVKDKDSGDWHAKTDDGSTIELKSGAANGAWNGQYWQVTTTDGTKYVFGSNRVPGWSDGDPTTQSAWTVPVFGNNEGEPCYHAGDFAGSWCNQAWRWNLDYSVDPHGNLATYYYQPEKNNYALNLDPNGHGTEYTVGGYPLRIDYGLHVNTDGTVDPATARVKFDVAERCLPDSGFACDPAQLKKDTAYRWPDVPFDQLCAQGATCTSASAAFFTRKRLTAVHSQVSTGGGSFADVDVWALRQSFPGTGDASPSSLWLADITHTGKGDGGSITLQPTSFSGYIFANRVDTSNDDYSPITRYRIIGVANETGGYLGVAYSAPDCVPGSKMPPSPQADEFRCYASYWSPPTATDPVLDWFHKYVVTDVVQVDQTGGAPDVKTHYDYLGGAAWHYDEGEFTPAKYKTWGEWRGYQTVRTTVGEPGTAQLISETLYLRGMDGDHLPSGVRHPDPVADLDGGTIVDQDPLQGFARESRTYRGTTLESASISDPWLKGPIATSTDGLLKAYRQLVSTVRGRTLLGDGSFRRTKVVTTFDDLGLVTSQENQGDVAVPGDDTCTKTTYAPNTAKGLLDRASEVVMFAGLCSGTASATNVITDVRTSYDGHAFGTGPDTGDITKVETLDTWDATGPHFVATARNTYDKYGRQLTSTDIEDNQTTTAFTPATGGPVTAITETNQLGWQSTTTLETSRGYPTKSVDVNGVSTDITYDALGRKTAVWSPGRSKSAGASASAQFSYTDSRTVPDAVLTKSVQDDGNYTSSYAIYDGLGRLRQTQTPGQGGGRVVADSIYDSRGLQVKTNNAYFNSDSGPTATLVAVADNDVPNQTVVEYDGRGRPVKSTYRSKGAEQWHSSVIYGGDRTTVIPPPGGNPQTTVTDIEGNVLQQLQYTNGYTVGAQNPADVTTYAYNAGGAVTSMTDSSGNVWRYGYDLRGRKISQHDPDAGDSTFTYDTAGNLVSTTDGRGKKLVYTYDKLDRRTAEYAGTVSDSTKLASWTYDTLTHGKGLPVASTRYVGTAKYVNKVVSYDVFSRPTATQVDIPTVEGAELGGKSYKFTTTYTATGAVAETGSPAAGNLNAETVVHTYTATGLPATTYAVDPTSEAITPLVSETDYTSFNEVSRMQLDGEKSTANVWITQTYQDGTRRPLTTQVDRAKQVNHTVALRTYGYDDAGKVTRIADAPEGQAPDVQCFAYDYLDRMSQAWTPASGDCGTQPAADALGGVAPYWQSYAFDKTGNRTSEVDHNVAGDVTKTYAYPASGAQSSGPHQLQSVSTVGPNGTAQDTYTYDASGDLKTRDVGGDTETFGYDDEGHLASSTSPSGNSIYVYSADGDRLVTHDPSGITISVGDLELFEAAGTHTVTATRFYEHGGGLVAEKSGSGVLTWMVGDQHGTGDLSIKAGTLTTTSRHFDPFGNTRGTPPPSWVDKHGFVGGYQDTTGLTHLGAREYDASTGRFTKADPLLDQGDPQQWNGYAYANNAPATSSDPSGEIIGWDMGPDYNMPGISHGGGDGSKSSTPTPEVEAAGNAHREAVAIVHKSKFQVFVDAAGELVKSLIGWDDIQGCFADGNFGSCVMTLINLIPWTKAFKAPEIISGFWRGARALITFKKDVARAEKVIVDTERVLNDANRAANEATAGARAEAQAEAARVRQATKDAKAGGKSDNAGGAGERDHASGDSGGREAPAGCNSFVPGTQVVMADGSHKPIESLHLGDKVKATDPATGKTTVRKVVATFVHTDEFTQTVLTIRGADGTIATLQATDWHPVWDDDQHGWVPIAQLPVGDHLDSLDGTHPVVVSVDHVTVAVLVHNFTIDAVHTYTVLAGTISILVHNCDRAGLDFTDAERQKVYDANAAKNGGVHRCDYCGQQIYRRASRDANGNPVRGQPDDAQIDHVVSRADGGHGGAHNGAASCRRCNRSKDIKPLEQWDNELREYLEP